MFEIITNQKLHFECLIGPYTDQSHPAENSRTDASEEARHGDDTKVNQN